MEVLFLLGRIFCADLGLHLGQEVELTGWLRQTRRVSSGLSFWVLHDRSGWVQVVVDGQVSKDNPPLESAICIQGRLVPAASKQGYEVQAKQIEILSTADKLPFELHLPILKAGSEQIFNRRVLSLRHARNQAIFKVKAVLVQAFRSYLIAQGFLEAQTPKIVATGVEGGAELFAVKYFDRPAYLAQSPQFYKQMLVCAGFERVFEVGPVFRAESHDTSRHINEFTSLDLELGFIDDEAILMELEMKLLRSMFAAVTENCQSELELLGVTMPQVDFIPRLELVQAQQILMEQFAHKGPIGDLDPLGEKLICRYAAETWGVPFVFITAYPVAKRPFYTRIQEEEPELTRSFDLLFKGLEVTTGGLRTHVLADLLASMAARGLSAEKYEFYLQAFSHGAPPHGGFAIGLERLTARLLDLDNLRLATLFPRDRRRLAP